MDIRLKGIDEAIAALERILKMGFKPSYSLYYQDFLSRTIRQRFLHAAKNTPYADSSQGTRKRSGAKRGSAADPGFGIDTGLLLETLTGEAPGGVTITDTVIELMAVPSYAPFVLEKFATKGPFAPGGLFDLTTAEIQPLIDLAEDQVQQEWLK